MTRELALSKWGPNKLFYVFMNSKKKQATPINLESDRLSASIIIIICIKSIWDGKQFN